MDKPHNTGCSTLKRARGACPHLERSRDDTEQHGDETRESGWVVEPNADYSSIGPSAPMIGHTLMVTARILLSAGISAWRWFESFDQYLEGAVRCRHARLPKGLRARRARQLRLRLPQLYAALLRSRMTGSLRLPNSPSLFTSPIPIVTKSAGRHPRQRRLDRRRKTGDSIVDPAPPRVLLSSVAETLQQR